MPSQIILIHGGAGKWKKERLSRAKESLLNIANSVKNKMGEIDPIDAVEFVIRCMEEDETFNAGRGAALNLFGEVELDAGIMTSSGRVGAVAAVKNVLHPISLAKIVMNELDHVLVSGKGAEQLAKLHNLYTSPDKLVSDYAYNRWLRAIREIHNYLSGKEIQDDSIRYYLTEIFPNITNIIKDYPELYEEIKKRYSHNISDTVGALASNENIIVAGVSTGGIFLKFPGRIGDSPIIGAGFYATRKGGCVATGHGEEIMKNLLCYKAVNYLEKYSAVEAAKKALEEAYHRTRIKAGLIMVDNSGNWGVYHTTDYFPVAVIVSGKIIVKDYWR